MINIEQKKKLLREGKVGSHINRSSSNQIKVISKSKPLVISKGGENEKTN